MTSRSSMSATMRISREHFGQSSGSASQTFLMSSRHFAEGMQRGACSETSMTATALPVACISSAARLSRWPRPATAGLEYHP